MPLKGVKSAKRQRQYKHIKDSAKKQGRSTARAEEIAARTVNKQRAESGEARSSRKPAAKRGRKKAAAKGRKKAAKNGKKGGSGR